jgi:hypothetical protein
VTGGQSLPRTGYAVEGVHGKSLLFKKKHAGMGKRIDSMNEGMFDSSLPIWLKKLRKVGKEISATSMRRAEQGVEETALLMTLSYNCLEERSDSRSIRRKVHTIQSAGRTLAQRIHERT